MPLEFLTGVEAGGLWEICTFLITLATEGSAASCAAWTGVTVALIAFTEVKACTSRAWCAVR